jgi:hypothetical protein
MEIVYVKLFHTAENKKKKGSHHTAENKKKVLIYIFLRVTVSDYKSKS